MKIKQKNLSILQLIKVNISIELYIVELKLSIYLYKLQVDESSQRKRLKAKLTSSRENSKQPFSRAKKPRTKDLKKLPEGCNADMAEVIDVVVDNEAGQGEVPNNHFITINLFLTPCSSPRIAAKETCFTF